MRSIVNVDIFEKFNRKKDHVVYIKIASRRNFEWFPHRVMVNVRSNRFTDYLDLIITHVHVLKVTVCLAKRTILYC